MITMSTLGSHGRLGNQFFQIASTLGIAKKLGQQLVLPPWEYAKYFEGGFPEGKIEGNVRLVQEPCFNYEPDWSHVLKHDNVDIKGYLQSHRYWENAKEEVKKLFTFNQKFKDQCWSNFFHRGSLTKDPRSDGAKPIAVSVRRGDYVNNPNYANLPLTYFIGALFERFPDWQERPVIFFSDDIPWCRVHFGCLKNVYFSENNDPIEDICLMSMCSEFLISNSTFSYWGATIANLHNPSKVVRPNHHFAGKLFEYNDDRDLYPRQWEIYDHLDAVGQTKKINLKDCSFHIPVFYDHADREENLNLTLKSILNNFDTEVIVMEQGGNKFEYVASDSRITYLKFEDDKFHRTRMLNQMAAYTKKPYILNWDADVLVAPMQTWLTAEALRKGADMVYPYSGAFARIPRKIWYEKLVHANADIGIVGTTKFSGMDLADAVSLGGCVAWNKNRFFELGGECETMVAYAPEDVEREYRAHTLGAKIERVSGPMYHLNHWVGSTSNTSNPYYPAARTELERIRGLSKEELSEEVKTWPKGS